MACRLREYLHQKDYRSMDIIFPLESSSPYVDGLYTATKNLFEKDALEYKLERWLDEERSQDLRRCFFFLLDTGRVVV